MLTEAYAPQGGQFVVQSTLLWLTGSSGACTTNTTQSPTCPSSDVPEFGKGTFVGGIVGSVTGGLILGAIAVLAFQNLACSGGKYSETGNFGRNRYDDARDNDVEVTDGGRLGSQ
jgi:hypothetical protein